VPFAVFGDEVLLLHPSPATFRVVGLELALA
jgi:hypothetical protein